MPASTSPSPTSICAPEPIMPMLSTAAAMLMMLITTAIMVLAQMCWETVTGRGEHQVAFVTQQAFIEPLDQDDLGHHEYSYHHAEVQQSQQRGRDAIQQSRYASVMVRRLTTASSSNRRIHRQAGTCTRLPLIFNNFSMRTPPGTAYRPISRAPRGWHPRSHAGFITPFLRKTTSSSTRSMSAIRWVDSSTDASSL